jgi:phage/plasmid primase-like uncharacterized protein
MPNANYKKATRLPVVVAFNAGNLLPVARALRERVPETRIVVLADDDHGTEGHPGEAKTDGPAPLHPGSSAYAMPPLSREPAPTIPKT